MLRKLLIFHAGFQRYETGLKLQSYLASLVKDPSENIAGYLFLVEHHPVYTTGMRSKDYGSEIEQRLTALGADFHRANRGGFITFHGPGQLVVYPILNLNHFQPKVKWYVQTLEKTIIAVCNHFNLTAYTTPDTGVWVNEKKVCAMGIRVSQYITTHGLALNCNTNLSWFEEVTPCELVGKKATSLSAECGRNINIDEVSPFFLLEFGKHFQCELEPCSKAFVEDVFAEIHADSEQK
ncbi:octanoyl-[acyl-carrier-protein]:protein N-octanoyltransferase LIPT2, mitochondrial [Planococcus citri]|uniref:octanoyl-[acyl-carrier-protein]:protein N-octanoyltransferase LIPT2, mitochondrial n=1 Tax=Planococcus citri TaxID=170843 RepID=UPI0031F9E2F7